MGAIPNHFHLLLRTGNVSVSTVMKRVLTGYAFWSNRKYGRHGHLFRNRYKSILCREDVWAAGRHGETVLAAAFCGYWAGRELGVTMISLSPLLNISVQAIDKSVIRGEKPAKAKKYSLIGK